jgi:signal transduction histidine kinase
VAAAVEINVIDVMDVGDITADADMMRATIVNLLLNAAQAMNGQGRIQLAMSRQDRNWMIEVSDNGPGIPIDLREQVLEPFFTTKARGGGLGLPIAKRVAELHGGTLTLRFPETGGTTATITAPVRPGQSQADTGSASR